MMQTALANLRLWGSLDGGKSHHLNWEGNRSMTTTIIKEYDAHLDARNG